MGIYLAIYKASINITGKTLLRILIVSIALVASLLSAYLWLIQRVTTFNYSIYTLATVLLVPTMLTLGSVASERGISVSEIFVTSSFFVYALHAFSGINPIMIVGKMERVLHVDGSLIAYLITPFAVYALSVLLYCILNKYLPRITHIITGR